MKGVHELYDKEHNFLGVFVEPDVWIKIKEDLKKILQKHGLIRQEPQIVEPLEDWELFKKCWDFKYPYDFSVECKNCGNYTENWEIDVPKKFFLTAANVSGLVSFRCGICGAKVVKKHFKDKIVTECIPKKE